MTGIRYGTKILQIQSTMKQGLLTQHTPEILSSYPKCTPDDNPVSVQQHDTKLDTSVPPVEGYTKLWMTGISPVQKFFKSSLVQNMAFQTSPLPLEFYLANPNAPQMIALCLCNNMTLSLTEAPFIGGNNPLRPCFVGFPVISVNSRKLFGAHV